MADEDSADEAARARGGAIEESGEFDLSNPDYFAMLDGPMPRGGERPNDFGGAPSAGPRPADQYPVPPADRLHHDVADFHQNNNVHQAADANAIDPDTIVDRKKMNEQFCPDGKSSTERHPHPYFNNAEEYGHELLARGSVPDMAKRNDEMLGHYMDAAESEYRNGDMDEANRTVSDGIFELEQDYEINNTILDASLPGISDTYTVSGIENHHCIADFGGITNYGVSWNERCVNEVTLQHLKNQRKYILMLGVNNLPKSLSLKFPNGSYGAQWYESVLVQEEGDQADPFYFRLKRLIQESHDALVEIAGTDGGETLEFRTLSGSMKDEAAQVDNAIFQVRAPGQPHLIKKSDLVTMEVTNWMAYAVLLEKGRYDFKRSAFAGDRPTPIVWKSSMKEDDKCSGENGIADGNEDEKIKCDRKAYNKGKCGYHILEERRHAAS